MPGAGKSTVGVILAKQTGRSFLDTDVLIQAAQGRTLQDIVDADGYAALRTIEAGTLAGLDVRDHVIATGGSAVYSAAAMERLQADGTVVFLDVDRATLESRVRDFGTRGLAKPPGQSFEALFRERAPLYRRYADIVVDCTALTQEAVCAAIVEAAAALT
ncbi:MAG: shikimate kinase [Lentisphaerae bacterium]|nr:shikimate kinase [Lentisphaerota bacterium]